MIGCLLTRVRKQPIIALYFESETLLRFYNLNNLIGFITKSLLNSLVTSRLVYCNALLSGVPNTIQNKLQAVQTTAKHVVTRASPYCHITAILKDFFVCFI